MKQRANIIAIVTFALVGSAVGIPPVRDRIASSIHTFRENFEELRQAQSMNTVERLIFSLALSRVANAAGGVGEPTPLR